MLFNAMRVERSFNSFIELVSQGAQREQENFIGKLRINRRLRKQAADSAYELYENAIENGETVLLVDGERAGIMTFFEWLIANQDVIFALIQRLISLFGL